MGLLDLFRPKWRHSNVEVRSEAVRALDADDRALPQVALKDPEASVRRLAIKKLADADLLAQIAESDSDEPLRKLAGERAGELLVGRATGDSDEAVHAVARISNPKALAEVAKSAVREAAWRAALEHINDAKAIADVARNARGLETRKAALARVSDAGVLRSIALNDQNEAISLLAVASLGEAGALEQLAAKAKLKSVRNAAKERLQQIAPERAVPESKQATRRKALQRQLCARAEAALEHRDLDEASAEMEAVRDAWSELGVQPGDDEMRVRFSRAVEKFEERRVAAAKPAHQTKETAPEKKPEPSEDVAEALARDEAARAQKQAEKDAQSAEREAKKKEREAEKEKRQAERARKEAERQQKEAEKKRKQEERERKRVENKAVWIAVCERLESLAASEDRAALETALKEAADATDGARELVREEEDALRERYQAARKLLVVKTQELKELDRWKSWANVPRLEALVAKMEALAAAETTKETAAQLKALQAEWKAAGPAPREKRDALWEKFKKAADEVYSRVKTQKEQAGADRAANLAKKEELCARVEALAESTQWKETAETIKLLQEEWKSIGPVAKDKSDEIWKRFRGACDKFFERRKEHFNELDANRDENLKKQEALIAKVEAVADSTQWKEAAELIKQYQAEWKEIGPAPKEKSEDTWKRFRGACDKFFERRKAHFAELDSERADNLKKKLLLCEKVEALAGSDDEATLDTVKALQAEWKTVGPAPKDQSDEVWNRFRAACDQVFERRRKAELEVPAEQPSGVSGFTNKLPLDEIAAQWAELAEPTEKK